jgi:hypothetical protein
MITIPENLVFTAELVKEYSMRPTEHIGKYENTVEFLIDTYRRGEGYSATLVWDYENDDEEGETCIGIWFDEDKKISQYDGCFEVPLEIIAWLKENGFDCSEIENDD